jgi:hypothetical protein
MKKATYLNGTEIPKSDPFYNIVNHKPELPVGIEYLKSKYSKLIHLLNRINIHNTEPLKEQIFNEVKNGHCEYLDAHVFCEVYLK